MNLQQFHSDFNDNIHKEDFSRANECLMRELGNILVRDKSDFVDMLQESGIDADFSNSESKLVNLFIENVKSNKKLLLGAALLVNMHNQEMSFDGNSEVSDEGVKKSYIVLNAYFNDLMPVETEEQSNWIGKAIQGAKRLIDNRKNKDNSASEWLAKQQMQQAAMIERQRQLDIAKAKQEEEAKKKRKRNLIIIGSSVAFLAVIITVIVIKRKK